MRSSRKLKRSASSVVPVALSSAAARKARCRGRVGGNPDIGNVVWIELKRRRRRSLLSGASTLDSLELSQKKMQTPEQFIARLTALPSNYWFCTTLDFGEDVALCTWLEILQDECQAMLSATVKRMRDEALQGLGLCRRQYGRRTIWLARLVDGDAPREGPNLQVGHVVDKRMPPRVTPNPHREPLTTLSPRRRKRTLKDDADKENDVVSTKSSTTTAKKKKKKSASTTTTTTKKNKAPKTVAKFESVANELLLALQNATVLEQQLDAQRAHSAATAAHTQLTVDALRRQVHDLHQERDASYHQLRYLEQCSGYWWNEAMRANANLQAYLANAVRPLDTHDNNASGTVTTVDSSAAEAT